MEFALKVTGTVIIPRCQGKYRENGYYAGAVLYQKGMTSWYIWWDLGLENWRISKEPGNTSFCWNQISGSPQPTGIYIEGSPEVEGHPKVELNT